MTNRPSHREPFALRTGWSYLLFVFVGLVLAAVPLPSQDNGIRDGSVAGPSYTKSLNYTQCDHATIVEISNAWPEAPPLSYALVAQGDPAPDPGTFDAIIPVPVRRIVSLATPVLAHLADLGLADRVVGIDTGDYVYSDTIRRRLRAGEITELGAGAELDLERLIALDADVVILSVYGPDDPTLDRIRAADIPVVIFADWREADPLARAEWITLLGLLTDRSRRARSVFAERARAYTDLRDRVASELADRGGTDRPTIMANAPWQGSWPVPAGDSYIARLFADAGGSYLWQDEPGTGSMFLDLEAVLARAVDADRWINGNFGWRNLEDVARLDPRLTAFAPYRDGAVYHYNRRVRESGANDFWESGATRPDLVLADLVRILHPDLLPDHELVYYRRLTP